MLLRTEGGEALVGAGNAYFLLPRVSHRYEAVEPVRKRFLSLAGPFALDLVRHFGISLGTTPVVVHCTETASITAWFDGIELIARSPSADPVLLATRWYQLLCRLASSAANAGAAARARHPAVERALDRIERRLSEPLSRAELAEEAGVSESHLSRIFARDTGMSVAAFIHKRRLEWAERLLRTSRLSITDIALSVGFDDPLYFSSRFRRTYGVSPREYRRMGPKNA